MTERIKPMPLWMSLLLFGIPSIIFVLATRYGIPWFIEQTGMLSVLNWFIVGGTLVFMPLFFAALIAYRLEGHPPGYSTFRSRFRLSPVTGRDWLWTFGAIILSFAGMGLIMGVANWLSEMTGWFSPLSTSPPFLDFHGLEEGQSWILLAWLPFFFFNIMGEELMWRGYIMPRQELRHGKWAWVIHGACWTMFHITFGLDLMIMLLPVMFIQSYVVQKRRNTWVGVLIHGIFNGPVFVAVSLNLMN